MASKVEDTPKKQPKRVEFDVDDSLPDKVKKDTDDSNDENGNKNLFKKIVGKMFKKKKKQEMVDVLKLFRYAKNFERVCLMIGLFGAVLNGAALPLVIVVWTDVLQEFSSYGIDCDPIFNNITNFTNTTTTSSEFDTDTLTAIIKDQTVYLVVLGLATHFLSYLQVTFWIIAAERQAKTIRKKLFESIMRQNIGWYDVYKSGELSNRLSDDVNKVRIGISDKFGNAIQTLGTFIISILIAFIKGWQLTLVIISVSPVLFLATVAFTKLAAVLTTNELKSYAKAGSIAEEVLSSIRTVFAFNGAQKEHRRYEAKLNDAKTYGIKKGFFSGFLVGFLWFVIFCVYSLGFWYGWKLSTEAGYNVGTVLAVFFLVLIGVFSLGNSGPFLGTMAEARAAAFVIFEIIDRVPPIDSSTEAGVKLDTIKGNIELKGVDFYYPSRTEVQILDGLNIKIDSGATVAFVGHSGCGKSTCIQLIQRFYDVIEGSVTIDDTNVKDMNVKWLRSQIGVVSQEPVLFATSISENIKFGKIGATEEEVVRAAKNANAHDFIMKLPDKYSTLVGDRGGQLSGGQKQRIAIARALVRNPRILLLDEATSALDNESEAIVQSALDRARLGRTTIIIAHRLTTIRNADVIFALEKGKVAEKGTHDELMAKEDVYYNLVINQQNASTDDEKNKGKKVRDEEIINDENVNFGDQDENKDTVKKKKKEKSKHSMKKVYGLNRPEWGFIALGCVASAVAGGIQPAFGVVLSKATNLFSLCSIDEQREQITLYCLLFLLFGFLSVISQSLVSGMFAFSGENLTKRLRSETFKSMLSQEIGWFDEKQNNVGTLVTKLAVEASAIQGATGVRLGFVLQVLANLGTGLIIAFIHSWAITMVVLAFLPFMIMAGIFQTKVMTGFANKDKNVMEEAGRISNEAISNIRTVVILNREDYFTQKFEKKIERPYKAALKSAHINGFVFGFTNSIMFYAIAAGYNLGARLIEENKFGTTFEDILIVFNVLIFGAQQVGQAGAFMPDYAKAVSAINSIFDLLERKTKINNWESKGDTIAEKDLDGDIQVKDIGFTYPSRPNAKILNGLNIHIKQGQKIALVGSSGCGKSTITQLLERFYDPDEGNITFCDKNINDLDLYWLRSKIGIVSQEPILFDTTIKENIAYGDNSRNVTFDEIKEAAMKSNIHDFICNLPLKYETVCGSKGTQLSGGQKQRIAIARALIRDPKILLLDEATSALDTESEKIVQDALEKAQKGRTCIVIAHRLSTVKNCDVILVIQNGKVLEQGTHDELLKMEGFYKKLNSQN